MKYIISIIMALMLISTAHPGTIRHDVEEEKYLELGQKYFCVKKLIASNSKNIEEATFASCVILNKHWCITAAHISQTEFDAINVIIDDKEHCIDKLIVNKNFEPSLYTGDIALGYCEKGFGENVPNLKLHRKKIEVEELCTIAGYGRYGNMLSGARVSDFKIRAGTNRILYKYNDMCVCEASKDNPTGLEFLPSIGDSGGGLFIDGELAAITCLIIGKEGIANSKYGDEVGFVEIYKYLEWIDNYVKKTQM